MSSRSLPTSASGFVRNFNFSAPTPRTSGTYIAWTVPGSLHLQPCYPDDTDSITAFTEKEATKLLEYMVWDHSHEDHYITETT